MARSSVCTTLAYKRLTNTLIQFDVYPPSSYPMSDLDKRLIPAVIYFHGGGLTVGNRRSWFPKWLHERVTSAGCAFISADYRLLPPATGHEIAKDIQDLLRFVVDTAIPLPSNQEIAEGRGSIGFSFQIDPDAIAVAGSSAGGLCAYLAAMHCSSPKPKAILSLYGQGGDFLTSHYLRPKTKPFLRGREILDPNDFLEYLYPTSNMLETITDSPLAYHPTSHHIPGYPSNPRMLIGRLYLQLGSFLDYYTGDHDPSLSCMLREALDANSDDIYQAQHVKQMRDLILKQHLPLFPQFGVTPSWPPTLLCHGTEDSAVHVGESRNLKALLERAGVQVRLIEFQGKEHSFDYEPDAEVRHKTEFDDMWDFLKGWLEQSTSAS
ncbi:alpha/beta-hydrolase [Tricholoma matsutake]|nr:alpha/beta-hydrolase [Tricholoma matsutake 945]